VPIVIVTMLLVVYRPVKLRLVAGMIACIIWGKSRRQSELYEKENIIKILHSSENIYFIIV
jgi:hypothetical protein